MRAPSAFALWLTSRPSGDGVAVQKPPVISEKLLTRDADAKKIELVKPLLLSGFAAAQEQAKEHAAEARGAWKALTGEAYGSEQAENWAVTLLDTDQDVSPEAIDKVIAEHAAVQAEIDKGTKYLGGLEEKQIHAAGYEQRKASLTEAAGLFKRVAAKRDATQIDLDGWERSWKTCSSASAPRSPTSTAANARAAAPN